MSGDDQKLDVYLPIYDSLPEDWKESRTFIAQVLRRIANTLNTREVGWYLDDETISGQSFIPGVSSTTNNYIKPLFRNVYRKVVDFGALPNAATKTVAHGIQITSSYTITRIYGAATDPVALSAQPIPNRDISLVLTATAIAISTTLNLSIYTRCYVVVEYMTEL
jgi:hypothetical protein